MNTRIELLSRKNKGKFLLKKHLPEISRILDRKINIDDFLELENSDEIRKIFYDSFKTHSDNTDFTQITFSADEFDQDYVYKTYLSAMDGEYYWISNYSEYCGIITIEMHQINGKILEIINFDGDSLSLISKNLEKGILLDYYENLGKYYYEISIW